jgi:predicted MPP superfamily phosphohydrolase
MLTMLYAAWFAPRWMQIVRLRIQIPDLPEAWEGLRVAHLSDFHAGGRGASSRLLERARAAALRFKPDLIALTGDYYDSSTSVTLHGLFDRWPAGVPVLAVTGNHDVYRGAARLDAIVTQLKAGGVQVLRNDAVAVPVRGRPAWIVGVDDPFTRHADEAAAFARLPSGEAALLFLTHSPASIAALASSRAWIMLCGHTHGGQIRVLPSGRTPFTPLLRRLIEDGPRREPEIHRGIHLIDDTVVVISDGLGTSQIPLRFRTRPQVVLIELSARDAVPPGARRVAERITILDAPGPVERWLS